MFFNCSTKFRRGFAQTFNKAWWSGPRTNIIWFSYYLCSWLFIWNWQLKLSTKAYLKASWRRFLEKIPACFRMEWLISVRIVFKLIRKCLLLNSMFSKSFVFPKHPQSSGLSNRDFFHSPSTEWVLVSMVFYDISSIALLGLTAAALSKHNNEFESDDEIITDVSQANSTGSSVPFSISGLTDCSNMTFQKVHKLWTSPLEEHKQVYTEI